MGTIPDKDIHRIASAALQIRFDILEMVYYGGIGHLGGSCSIADVAATLYFHTMRVFPGEPKHPQRDYFLLSKGHTALVQYACLGELGFFPKSELRKFKRLGAMLQGHPDMTKTPGIEASTGSLGQGLSIAVGLALGLRVNGQNNRVYVIIGDGELAEGQIWEAAMAAAFYKVDNLTAVVDYNGIQATGHTRERFEIPNLRDKWEAFGWNAVEIDGHCIEEILEGLAAGERTTGKPTVLIAHTIKGKGFPFAEDQPPFHYCTLTQEQYEMGRSHLTAKRERMVMDE